MRTKIYLTSIIAMSFAMPALAETFPLDGLMKENKTYENAAISTNMAGVYEGIVYANAQYEDTEYPLTAGKYLPANSETVTNCADGSYCDGALGSVYYNATTAQGIQSCPNGYNHSDANASADTQCYRTCDINNMGTTFTNIAHATAVSGNDYYNTTGTDTCAPTSCDPGWHTNSPILMTVIGTSEAGSGYTSNQYAGLLQNGNNMSNSIISGDILAFAVDYGDKGVIIGHGRCSKTQGYKDTINNNDNAWNSPTTFVTLTDETGQSGAKYCYCQLDSYTANGNNTAISLTGPWVFYQNRDDMEDCEAACASDCAHGMLQANSGDLAFRAAVFGNYSAELGPATSCEANTITINWNGTTQTEIDANEAGTATYGGNIRTPRSATPVTGKTFTGWLFSTTAPSGN